MRWILFRDLDGMQKEGEQIISHRELEIQIAGSRNTSTNPVLENRTLRMPSDKMGQFVNNQCYTLSKHNEIVKPESERIFK